MMSFNPFFKFFPADQAFQTLVFESSISLSGMVPELTVLHKTIVKKRLIGTADNECKREKLKCKNFSDV